MKASKFGYLIIRRAASLPKLPPIGDEISGRIPSKVISDLRDEALMYINPSLDKNEARLVSLHLEIARGSMSFGSERDVAFLNQIR